MDVDLRRWNSLFETLALVTGCFWGIILYLISTMLERTDPSGLDLIVDGARTHRLAYLSNVAAIFAVLNYMLAVSTFFMLFVTFDRDRSNVESNVEQIVTKAQHRSSPP